MGRRRDAAGTAIAGKDAPADLFRRVSSETNEMMEHRAGQRKQGERIVAQKPPAKQPQQRRIAKATETRGSPPPSTPRRFAQPYYPLMSDHELWPGEAEELLERW
jgi:hypothetical protein